LSKRTHYNAVELM